MRAILRQALALSILLSSAEHAGAQTPNDAIALGHGALELYEDGKYESALTLFRRADATAHSPVFALYIARCQSKLGSLLAARRSYRALLEQPLDSTAPAPWKNAHVDARTELAELGARIPSIVLEASFVPTAVELDGEALSSLQLGSELELDPGPHRVTLRSGTAKTERTLRIQEGERAVRVRFETLAPGTVQPIGLEPAPAPARKAPSAEPVSRGGTNPAVVVPIVIGAAALAVGTTAGIVALVKTQNLKARCDADPCDPADEWRRDEIYKWASVSTIAFGVAGGGLTLGAVLYLSDPDRGTAKHRATFLVAGNLP